MLESVGDLLLSPVILGRLVYSAGERARYGYGTTDHSPDSVAAAHEPEAASTSVQDTEYGRDPVVPLDFISSNLRAHTPMLYGAEVERRGGGRSVLSTL